ncbi:MAG: hypothetical protein NC254_07105 [bacterium]|nr:hypothetical protein [bacterium]
MEQVVFSKKAARVAAALVKLALIARKIFLTRPYAVWYTDFIKFSQSEVQQCILRNSN